MILANTTGDFAHYGLSNEERIRHLHAAGFRHIDFNLYNDNTLASPFMQPNWRDCVFSLKELAEGLGMDFVQAHLPNFNPLQFDDSWETAVEIDIRAIEVCAMLGIKNAVIHTGTMPGIGKEEYFEKNMPFISRLFPVMEKTGVQICVENGTKANAGEQYFFFTGRDMKDFIEYAGHPLIKACWDTGHANIEGHQYEDLIALGTDLCAVHIHDNEGQRDEHLLPYVGSLNLDEVMNGLLDIGYSGAFTFECDSTLRFHDNWTLNRRSFQRDTRLADPILALQDSMERTMFILGEHILKTYNCYEA